MSLKKYLFKLARSNFSGYFIGFAFEKLSPFIPVEKITENKYVIVFHHPVKHWQRHILIVPKKSIRNFLSINLDNDWGKEMIISVFKTGIRVAKTQKIDKYTILVNGGKYQDVPQVHFHLASGNDKLGGVLGDEKTQFSSNNKIVFESSSTGIYSIYDDKIKKHFIVKPKKIYCR
ncbi:MAG: HIT domain-containing protein [Patescibacteria group bacterium]